MPRDLHELPKLRDSISYLYFEHAIIVQEDSSIVVIQEEGRIPVPIASVTCLLLGPGTRGMPHACGDEPHQQGRCGPFPQYAPRMWG